MVATTNQEQMQHNMQNMLKSLVKVKGFRFASLAGTMDLVETMDLVHSYYAALMNFGADIPKDIGIWFNFPVADWRPVG